MTRTMLKKLNIFVLFLILLFAGQNQVQGQNTMGVGMGNSFLQPVGSLQNWFKGSFKAPQISFIFNRTTGAYWQVFVTTTHFNRPNQDKLFYKDLELDLKLYGAGIAYVSYLTRERWHLQPFWSASITLYRWEALRGAYQTENRLVPERFQQAWSFAGAVGPGILFHLSDHLKLSGSAKYQLVVAELWPALALHLENVSGLQMLNFNLTLHWWF